MDKPVSWKASGLPWLVLSAVVIVADQIVKAIVLAVLRPYEPHEAIAGLLNWTLAFNRGAAFSFLHDESGWQRWLFSLLAIGVSVVLVRWLASIARSDWRNALPLSLVIGGALGNLIDRVRFGQVTDFIDVYWRDAHFPAFNIADSAITVGAVLLIWFGFFAAKKS
ncbi:MAG: signal peptidase II [Rudaea sp.]|uniref:signal peptidase II n=1 Tax=Rudaea sp. TaxID=2136325 RepID=UPI0010F61C3F|nr:signal peptidase II [Rudaea sp.]MBN8886709.1 signal peptidase II [Rudaea sp.]MBR0345591.1 signal peptidase II [Rudaea sp.]